MNPVKTQQKTKYFPAPMLMEEAAQALIEKLGPSKASQFWTGLGYGRGDYAKTRKEMFKDETVDTLYSKIKEGK